MATTTPSEPTSSRPGAAQLVPAAPAQRKVKATAFSRLLRYHRTNVRLSQLSLALTAEISARHLSYLETGKSNPSRQMVVQLAQAMELPHRDTNALLKAAGFAPLYRHTELSAPEMAPFRDAIQFMLKRQAPYPAVLIDRYWNLLQPNAAATSLIAWIFGGPPPASTAGTQRPNTLRWLFDDDALRPHVVNWEVLAATLIQRVHRDVLGEHDLHMQALLASLLASPGVPADWRRPDLTQPPAAIIPMVLRKDGVTLSFFSLLTTLGTPQDITLQEIRLETFFPADPVTEAWIRNDWRASP